jgi:hypothetical protein
MRAAVVVQWKSRGIFMGQGNLHGTVSTAGASHHQAVGPSGAVMKWWHDIQCAVKLSGGCVSRQQPCDVCGCGNLHSHSYCRGLLPTTKCTDLSKSVCLYKWVGIAAVDIIAVCQYNV